MPSGLSLFIGMGQSNWSGRTALSDAPYLVSDPRIWNYKLDGTWQNPAADPLMDKTGSLYPVMNDVSPLLGPAQYFAERWLQFHPNEEVGLVQCARGGRFIADYARDLSTATMYGASKARWEAAAVSGTIKGILWYQGEADSDTSGHRDAWEAAFLQLCIDWRSDIGIPNLPIVMAKIAQSTGATAAAHPYTADLQVIQSRIRTGKCAIIQNDDATLYDEVHLSGDSLRTAGYRMADAMRLLGPA